MSLTVSKPDEENDLPEQSDSYKNTAGNINVHAPAASETFDKIGTAAAEYNDADTGIRENLGNLPANSDNEDANDSPLSWIIPLVLLFLLIVLGYAFCGNSPTA